MTPRTIICLLGNAGCGKTSLCELINSKNEMMVAIERSNGLGAKYGIDPSIVDQLILEYTFDSEQFNQSTLPDQTIDGEDIYWVILDCHVDTLLQRLECGSKRDIWETEKALIYFQQRFRQLGAHFGIPFLDTTHLTLDQVHQQVLDMTTKRSHHYRSYRQIGTQLLNPNLLQEYDIENKLSTIIKSCDLNEVTDLPEYAGEFHQIDQQRLYIRWYVNNHSVEIDEDKHLLRIGDYQVPITGAIFKLAAEGESKKIYRDISGNPFTKDLAFILLKSTIYSHSMQVTGEIRTLGAIRARGSQIFLEMMWRNNLKHSYRSINSHGMIVSDFIEEISPLEIIVKRFCEGTDKKSFYEILQNENIVVPNSNAAYISGPYVRFDWRNPNHVSPTTRICVKKNPYYYIYEQTRGKETFFKEILTNEQYAIPVGDKNITEDLIANAIDTKQTKLSVLKMFMVIQSYFSRVNLVIKDVCFMLNTRGEQFWSEINQDCMRITANDSSTNKFDKDIWRAGGLSSREEILTKWKTFNQIFIEYFRANKFHRTELFNYNSYFYQTEIQKLLNNEKLRIPPTLQQLWLGIRGKHPRRVLVTMDMYNGQPVLVKSSRVCEIHHDGDYRKAMEKISIFPDILLVDLDGAFGHTDDKNRQIIKNLAQKYHIFTGGGLRSLKDVEDVLKSSVRRCVIASADDALITQIPKERLIVEMSVNEQNEVLIHGRTTNTHLNIITRIQQLCAIGVHAISITFVQAEGHLAGIPRQQIQELMLQIPQNIRKIYIAGGISTLDDLEYLWSFPRVIPQLGSAIWKNKLTIGSIFNSMIHFDDHGIVSAIIQDLNGPVKGLCYMNRQSIEQTCQERVLYRCSRKLGRVIMKGETSGDIQQIIKISLDCDSDSMLITVDSKRPFCHTGDHSCFNLQTSIKANLATLADYIKSQMNSDSYSGRMQRNPQLALAKVMEEFWEVMASHRDHQVAECSDLLVHLVMYLNGMGVTMEDIFNELNARRWAPNICVEEKDEISECELSEISIAVTTAKYTDKTDRFAAEELGIRIVRHAGRKLLLQGEIVDREKFSRYFGHNENMKLSLFSCKPKDMAWLLALRRVTHLITFETVIKNYPTVYTSLHEVVDPTISIALICRKGACIEPDKWTKENKPLIAAEHVYHVTRFFEQNNISPFTYHLDRVTGSSEGFLINTDKYLLADAVVESGKTLEENGLEIWKVIIPKGQVHIALYGRYQ